MMCSIHYNLRRPSKKEITRIHPSHPPHPPHPSHRHPLVVGWQTASPTFHPHSVLVSSPSPSTCALELQSKDGPTAFCFRPHHHLHKPSLGVCISSCPLKDLRSQLPPRRLMLHPPPPSSSLALVQVQQEPRSLVNLERKELLRLLLLGEAIHRRRQHQVPPFHFIWTPPPPGPT
jgi:hypothetical protein